MPELPEVEASRKYFERHCQGKVVQVALVQSDEKVFCGHSVDEIKAAFEHRRFLSADRHGKYFWTNMDGDGDQVLFHFGMTGHVLVRHHGHPWTSSQDKDIWPPRFTKLELIMDDGTQIAFSDARRFAKIRLLSDPKSQDPVRSLGPDAYSNMPQVEEFASSLRASRRPVKTLLIDQGFLAGIGNWVADEVLYQASIFPETKAHLLTDTQAELLHIAIRDVLKIAVEAGAQANKFPSSWLFHHRWTGKRATKTAHGQAVNFLTVGGRTTAYVPAVQAQQKAWPSTNTPDVCDKSHTAQDSATEAPSAPRKKRSRQLKSEGVTTSPIQRTATAFEPQKGNCEETSAVRDSSLAHSWTSGRPVRPCRRAQKKV